MQGVVEKLAALDLAKRAVGHKEDGVPTAGGVKSYSLNYKVSDQVTVTIRDKYSGMRGGLVSKKGKMFWNTHLARDGEEPGKLIWKMTTSFKPTGSYGYDKACLSKASS